MHPSPGGDVGDDAPVLPPSMMCASLKRVLPDSVLDVDDVVIRWCCPCRSCSSCRFQQEHVARPHQPCLDRVPPWPQALWTPLHIGLARPCRQDVRNTLRPRHASRHPDVSISPLQSSGSARSGTRFSPLLWLPLLPFDVRGELRKLTRAPPHLRHYLVCRFPHRLRHPC